jgi:cytochrome c oxidase subunit 3
MNSEVTGNEVKYALETKIFGFWIFLAMETMFFGSVLFLYTNERFFYPEAFKFGSHLLNLRLGTLNTAVLLTSSLTMALAQHFFKNRNRFRMLASLIATALLGGVFLFIKSIELQDDYRNSLIPGVRFSLPRTAPSQTALFQSLYLFAISIHALHLTIGILWCLGLAYLLLRNSDMNRWQARMESSGLYWHFVDIVWVFLFPLFYLNGGPS